MNLRGLPEGPPVKWACILVWLCVHSDPSYVEVQPLDSWYFCQLDWKSICSSLRWRVKSILQFEQGGVSLIDRSLFSDVVDVF
ncbi:hypothetical protein TNCV_3609971 [Trichonephila clavipes]|nr:hypothetical protein TNCV_3609971 [Trichonephila clavipes]